MLNPSAREDLEKMVLCWVTWEKNLATKVCRIGVVRVKVVHGHHSFPTVSQVIDLAVTKDQNAQVFLPCMMAHHLVQVFMVEQDLLPRVKVEGRIVMDCLQATSDLCWTLMTLLTLWIFLLLHRDKKQENLHLPSLGHQPHPTQGHFSHTPILGEGNLETQNHHTKVQQPPGSPSPPTGETQIMCHLPNKNAVDLMPFKSCCRVLPIPSILETLASLEPFKDLLVKTYLVMEFLHQTSSTLLHLTAWVIRTVAFPSLVVAIVSRHHRAVPIVALALASNNRCQQQVQGLM